MDLLKRMFLLFDAPDSGATGTLSIEQMVDDLAADDKKIDDKGAEIKDDDLLIDDEPEVKKEEKEKKEEIDLEDQPEVEIDDLDAVEDAAQQRWLQYDRAGDGDPHVDA